VKIISHVIGTSFMPETAYTTRVCQYGAVPLGPFPKEGIDLSVESQFGLGMAVIWDLFFSKDYLLIRDTYKKKVL
jgi:hypothetical protein